MRRPDNTAGFEMKCRKWQIMVSAAADGELAGRDAELLAAHTAGCSRCRDYAESVENLRSGLAAYKVDFDGGQFFETRLAARIKSQKIRLAERHFWRRFILRPIPMAAAAALIILTLYATLQLPTFRDAPRLQSVQPPASSSDVMFLSSPEEEENFEAALIEIYYGIASASDCGVGTSGDNNNDVSRVTGNGEAV